MRRDKLPDKKTASPNDSRDQSNEPVEQEEPEKPKVTPDEVWHLLSHEVKARVKSLLARMAYKYALTQPKPSQDETEVIGEIPGHESQDHP